MQVENETEYGSEAEEESNAVETPYNEYLNKRRLEETLLTPVGEAHESLTAQKSDYQETPSGNFCTLM